MEDFDFAVRLDYDERQIHPEIFENLDQYVDMTMT